MKIVSIADTPLASVCAQSLGTQVISLELTRFADGEVEVTCQAAQDLGSEHVCLVFQVTRNADINSQVLELLLIAGFLKSIKVQKITALLPYLPYARHDTGPGGVVGSIDVIVRLLKEAGIDEVYTADLHAPEVMKKLVLPMHEISLTSFWADFARSTILPSYKGEECVLASPDEGWIPQVTQLGKALSLPFVSIEKKRVGTDQTKAISVRGEVKGKTVLLFDDIFGTGGTALNAAKLLTTQGAKRVIGCFSHALFAANALTDLEAGMLEHIYVTNSIKDGHEKASKKITVVSIDNVLCNQLAQ